MKIILAIDLFDDKLNASLIYEELRNWCTDLKTEVKPVFINASSMGLDLIFEQLPHRRADFESLLQPFADLEIIDLPLVGKKKEVEALLEVAKKEKADFIALISQGKNSIEKTILGSFAETLLAKSDIPILFLDEEPSLREKTNKILFATDFSDVSKTGFSLLLNQVKKQNPEIVIFNAIPLPQFPASGYVYAQALNILPQHYWDEQLMWAETKGLELLIEANKHGLQARLEIANQVFSIENTIHEVVRREKVKLIAMTSVSQPLQRTLLGSVSRSILRTRLKPVWICGPQCF